MRKNYSKLIIILIAISVFTLWGGCKGKTDKGDVDKDMQEALIITAKELNKQTPAMIDHVTRIDKIEAQGNQLISYYTILTDTGSIDKGLLRQQIVSNMKKNPETIALANSNVIYTIVYRDTTGSTFFRLSVDASDLQ